MNKTFASLLAILVVVAGVAFYFSQNDEPAGGVVIDQDSFVNGFYAGDEDQLSVDADGDLTTSGTLTADTFASGSVGSSSSSPAALGSAVSGHMIIASAATTASASTTAVTANSTIILQQEFTSPIAGTTCKSTSATTTPAVASKIAGNGFTVSLGGTVTGNTCLAYWIIN